MVADIVPSDVAILDLLRKRDTLTVAELASLMEVTATAVRQRLTRLMAQGYVCRVPERAKRGRPSHRYELTAEGRRKTGSNFADLAIALWQEIREISDAEVRRGLLQRISRRLAAMYGTEVRGETVDQKMESLVALFAARKVPFEVEQGVNSLPILTALACPYPSLAEQDRAVCAMEKMLFAELVGAPLKLSRCRLNGDSCCTFEVQSPESNLPEPTTS